MNSATRRTWPLCRDLAGFGTLQRPLEDVATLRGGLALASHQALHVVLNVVVDVDVKWGRPQAVLLTDQALAGVFPGTCLFCVYFYAP